MLYILSFCRNKMVAKKNNACPVESCIKIRFQHVHVRKLDGKRKNCTIWYVQPINLNEH